MLHLQNRILFFIMASHNLLGKEGEQIATEFVIKQGMIVRERNWRYNNLEVDIIAETPGRLHFIEVKTRSDDEHFDPMKSITKAKIRNLVNASNGYIHAYHLKMEIEFDVILVIGNAGDFKVQYIADAFYPPLRTYR